MSEHIGDLNFASVPQHKAINWQSLRYPLSSYNLEASGQLNCVLVWPLRKIHMGFKDIMEKRPRPGVNRLGIPRVEIGLSSFEIYEDIW